MSENGYTNMTRRDFVKNTSAAAAASALVAGLGPLSADAAEQQARSAGIFGDIYRQLHIDTHFGGFREIYRNFDGEACAQAYEDAGFQMVSYFAKCWAGYSYYPTKIGVVHPGIERDFTGELTQALKKRGIRRIVYFMLGMDRQYGKTHPEWVRNTDSGKALVDTSMIADATMMCFNSPYIDEVGLPQMKEVVERYDIDGFFIDIVMQQFLQSNCYCKYCRESFAKEVGGKMPTDNNDPKAFAYRKWSNRHMEALMEKVYRYLAAVKPGIEIINNYAYMNRYPVTPPAFLHHICWDTPVPAVGCFAWNFSFEARYLMTLPGITWSCMNTRGNTWGEYSLREPEAFMSECATLLAACGRTYLSDIPYPHGNPDKAVMKVFTGVNRRTEDLETFVKGCVPVEDVAVLHAADSIWSKAPLVPTPSWVPDIAYHSVAGAHKALIEGHVNMSILNSDRFPGVIDNYRALVLPDQRILGDRECEAIRRFVTNGGVVLATCMTGIRDSNNKPLKDFALADVFGVRFKGDSGTANSYLRVREELPEYGIPAMDVQIMGPYARIETTTARTLMELVPPFEGIKNGTPPPALDPECPGVTINVFGKGKAIYCASQLFDAYYKTSTPVLRKLALWMLGQVYPDSARSIVCGGAPINVELFYNRRGTERFVHLVNYSGDKREVGVPQTQNFTVVHGITVSLRLEKKPSSITVVPEGKNVAYTYSNGLASFNAEPLGIHGVYRILL